MDSMYRKSNFSKVPGLFVLWQQIHIWHNRYVLCWALSSKTIFRFTCKGLQSLKCVSIYLYIFRCVSRWVHHIPKCSVDTHWHIQWGQWWEFHCPWVYHGVSSPAFKRPKAELNNRSRWPTCTTSLANTTWSTQIISNHLRSISLASFVTCPPPYLFTLW